MTAILPPELVAAAAEVVARGQRIAVAESCTGGLVAAALTEVPGASAVLLAGFVAYANEAKSALLGVDPGIIAAHGAVSEETARAMAEGALGRSGATLAVSITGIAGPGGGSLEKPVGTVVFGLARTGGRTEVQTKRFDAGGGRGAIRLAAALHALALLAPSPLP